MGIQLLLRLLKDSLPETHLSAFRNQKAAVDGLNWVYKACYPAALELLQQTQTNQHIDVFFSYIAMLKYYQIEPIIVFDGRVLQYKKKTLVARDASRMKNQTLAKQFSAKGDKITARKYAQRGIKINRYILHSIIAALKNNGIKVIISPYQADAQLAYLVNQNQANFAISQDSDLIVYHVSKILFKLNLKGKGQFFQYQQIVSATHKDKHVGIFFALPQKQRIYCCILGGCDYFQSLRGIGLKTILNKMIDKPCLQNLLINMKQKKDAPPELQKKIWQVYCIFKHHWVYDPANNRIVNLTPLDYSSQSDFLGPIDWYNPSIANAQIDSMTLEPTNLQKFNRYKPPAYKSLIIDLQHEQTRWEALKMRFQSKSDEQIPNLGQKLLSPYKSKGYNPEQKKKDIQDLEKCLNNLQNERMLGM